MIRSEKILLFVTFLHQIKFKTHAKVNSNKWEFEFDAELIKKKHEQAERYYNQNFGCNKCDFESGAKNQLGELKADKHSSFQYTVAKIYM